MIRLKTQLLTVVGVLLLPLAAFAQPAPNDIGGTAANPDDNQQLQDVRKVNRPIVIDGDLSEWRFRNAIVDPLIGIPKVGRDGREDGDPPTEYVIHEELGGTWTGPEDQSSMTEIVWKSSTPPDPDVDGLYVGVVVTDDYHEHAATGAGGAWNGDGIQMMITVYDADLEEHSTDEFALYNFALEGIEEDHEPGVLLPDEIVVTPHFERPISDFFDPPEDHIDYAIVRDTEEKKTYYELRFGAEALGFVEDEWVEGAQLGLGFVVNDGDEIDTGQKGWVGLGAHAIVFGKTPSEVALLTLGGPQVDPPACDPDSGGDLDGNGTVEFADFLILSGNFGNAATSHTEGDIDCNGTVEFADFLVLSGNFGNAVGQAAAVPEPSALGLFGFSMLCAGFLRRRR